MLHDGPIVINVRLAGYAHCWADLRRSEPRFAGVGTGDEACVEAVLIQPRTLQPRRRHAYDSFGGGP
jgi:hypothetical protein